MSCLSISLITRILGGIIQTGCLILVIYVALEVPALSNQGGDICVIVNKNAEISKLTLKDLQLIYKGKKKVWNNGQNIVLFLPPFNSKPMKMLAEKILKVSSEADVSAFYLRAVFQQVFVDPPKAVPNTKYAVAEVSAVPGGIALVDDYKLDLNTDKVKIIRIEEK